MFSFTTRTVRGGNMRNVIPDPDPYPENYHEHPEVEDLALDFEEMLTHIMGPQAGRPRGFPNDPMMPPFFPFGGPQRQAGFGGFTATGNGRVYADPNGQQQFGNINE